MQAIHVVQLSLMGLQGAFHTSGLAITQINTIFGMAIILQKMYIQS